MQYTVYQSPVGGLCLMEKGGKLAGLYFGKTVIAQDYSPGKTPLLDEVCRQLRLYFEGKLREFDIPLAAEGTVFRIRVWDELLKIPYGKTITYGELASRIGNPKASRAVGGANHANPISIIIPCHRVIGAGGALTGYGGGMENKKLLLELERRYAL